MKTLLKKYQEMNAVDAKKVKLAVKQSDFNSAINEVKKSLGVINREKSVIKAGQKELAGFIREAKADAQNLMDLSRDMEKNDMNGAPAKKKADKLEAMADEAIKVLNDAKSI